MAYTITEKCIGCRTCVRICPTGAITGQVSQRQRVDALRCIDCGACGRICPMAAVKDPTGTVCARIRLRRRWPKPRFILTSCAACRACLEICPVDCLALTPPGGSRDSVRQPVLARARACIGCGLCAETCPVEAVTMEMENETEAAAPPRAGNSQGPAPRGMRGTGPWDCSAGRWPLA